MTYQRAQPTEQLVSELDGLHLKLPEVVVL